MRKVLLVVVATLLLAQPAAAHDRKTLERYAEGTWRSFAAMTDEQSGLPPDILERNGTRSVQTSTTNIGAYMWSAVAAERLRDLPSRAGEPPAQDDHVAREDGPPRERPVLQLVRPPHRREARAWPPSRRPVRQLAVVGRQRLARDRPEGRGRQRPRAVAPGPRAVRQHGLRLLLPARGNRILFHYVSDTGDGAVLLRHVRLREPDRQATSASPRARSRRRRYSAPGARSATRATGAGPRRSRSASTARTSASRCSTARWRTTTRWSPRAGAAACSRR